MVSLPTALRAGFRRAVHRVCLVCAAGLQGGRPGRQDLVAQRRRAGSMPAAAGSGRGLNLGSADKRLAVLLALVITPDRVLSALRCGAHVGGRQRRAQYDA